ncbi:MAG: V-type ATP synthase subunit D [Candidatus Marsarchaeota archaeon]|nr:V-type ATP synthase subunit D [Candidatus Marsarchaeota archaeon]MCL5112026.1 V-type ATP synthase subunit D [Candidatus Marsarchaeota archaeon]
MAIGTIKTTRIELIRTKARVKVATKGLSLLKMKRASLVLEFFSLARQIELLRANLGSSVQTAMDSTKIADIQAGRINVERIAAEQATMLVGVNARNVMGVRIPNLSIESGAQFGLGYELISVPTAVEDARKSYRSLFSLLVEIAEKENSLRKLLYEIEKLNRRANAIENVVIPGMHARISYIRQRLEDLERDQIVSLKFIKRKMDG